MESDTEPGPDVSLQRCAAPRLAGLGATQLEHVTPRLHAAQVRVETDHAMNLGPREIQRPGKRLRGFRRHPAQLVLDGMENRQERILSWRVGGDQAMEEF